MLIAPANSQLNITEMIQLRAADIHCLAVEEFRNVPARQYAQQALKALNLI